MRRFGVLAVVLVALPFGGAGRPLPLHSEQAATAPLTAIVSDAVSSRLVTVDSAAFAPLRTSSRIGWYDGWARAPDGKLLAVAVQGDTASTLRFANAGSLRWVRQSIHLHGFLRGALWPTESRLYAVTGDCCNSTLRLETVDTVAKRVVATRMIDGTAGTIVHAPNALVLLGEDVNAIGSVRLEVIDAGGGIRSVTLDRIRGGWHYDQTQQDPLGTVRQPGLTVDPAGGVAYVVDASGIVAAVRLADLAVTYHQLGVSLLARFARWLQPDALAKGENGPERDALWLGDGLIAVTGADYTAVRHADGSDFFASSPAGLRVIDTHDWTIRTIDSQADTMLVADGVLLTSGGTWQNGSSGEVTTGEGVAAWNADGSLRWRYASNARVFLLDAYGSRAVVLGNSTSALPKLIDLATGNVVRTFPTAAYPWLLLGAGS